MDFHLDRLLGLPNVTVESYAEKSDDVYLNLRLLNEGINCPHCQNYTEDMHQNRPTIIRDLPICGRRVYLQVPRRQFKCSHCEKSSTEPLDFLKPYRRHTQRYEEYIYQRVTATNIEQVGREEQLKYDEVKGVFDFQCSQHLKKNWQPAHRISLDEISNHKGHQDFKTVVSDIDRGKLLEVIDGHTQAQTTEALESQPSQLREQVEEVSVDMWGGFPKVIANVFPNARIVFDRFHVMKAVNDELNRLRIQLGITGRSSRYLLSKNAENLSREEQAELELVLAQSPCLRIAHELKEELHSIYETSSNFRQGKNKMTKWLRSARLFYRSASQRIQKHLEGICNYFINRTTSGTMEGINNKIKLIMRQAYGFSNFEHMRSRLIAAFELH